MSSNFYVFFNTHLRGRAAGAAGLEEVSNALLDYLVAFKSAWNKLRPREMPVFRGIAVRDEDLDTIRREYMSGRILYWHAVTSVSADERVAAGFEKGTEAAASFRIAAVDARSVKLFSAIPSEDELLLFPGTSFLVNSPPQNFMPPQSSKVHVCFLQQMKPEQKPFSF